MGQYLAFWEDRELRSQVDREDLGGRHSLAQCPSRPIHLQCATYKLCHPEELVLLGHSLGIPQASLSRCSSQVQQLVSIWRRRGPE